MNTPESLEVNSLCIQFLPVRGLFLKMWHTKSAIEYHQSRLCGAKPRSVTPSVPRTTPSLLSETDVPTRHVPDGSRGCGKAQPGNRASVQFRQRSIGYRSNIEQRQELCDSSRRRKLCVANERADPFTKQPIAMLQQPALSQRLRSSAHGSSLFDPMENGNRHAPCTAQPGVAT